MKVYFYSLLLAASACSLSACSDDDVETLTSKNDAKFVGTEQGNFSADEWYPGGKLGTTENVYAACYEDETPAVTQQGLTSDFKKGELFFERSFTQGSAPFKGLGPASVRRSCLDCHPNYGHGKRFDKYVTSYGNGNGYLLVVYNPTDGANSNDGPFISEVTPMPQTQAQSPFLPPIDESKIDVQWHEVTAMESGLPMKFPDGEEYHLIYPDVNIPRDAFNVKWESDKPLAFRLESTIGIIGTGLIDAIPQDSIIKQYKAEAANFQKMGMDVKEHLNPSFFDAATNEMASGAFYGKFTAPGALADGTVVKATDLLKRYTYALTRATLQDGPGANAIWNITNVSRPDRPNLYTTNAWAEAMAENEDVINKIAADPTSPYYDADKTKIPEKVKALLSPGTNQFDNTYHNFKPEMSNDDFYALMVWHRGLSIPRARNLNDPQVQRGKELFHQMGCVSCHRPSWTTGEDNYWVPDNIKGRQLPRYANQKIYPYSDFVQHKLYMKNDIHGSWCRTTPLWGRGLAGVNGSGVERLHDCRARNVVEAIMWHAYSKNSHAYFAASKFYNLPKADRDAVVKFIESI